MISTTAEYALRSVVFLAQHAEQARTAQEIAAATLVPGGYVSKVLQDLARAGIVNSQRGPKGGFTLARPANDMTLLEVVNAVDPIHRIHTCPLGIPSHGTKLCKLHQRLDQAIAAIEGIFSTAHIADLMEADENSSRCAFPPLGVTIRASPRPPKA